MVFFKAVSSIHQNTGDAYWISSDGSISVVIDAVSISHNPSLTKDTIIDFLEDNEESFSNIGLEDILKNLNAYLYTYGNSSMMAVIGIVKKLGDSFQVSWVGNIRLYAYKDNEKIQLLEPLRRPDSVIGQNKEVLIKSMSHEIKKDYFYILATDGIELECENIPNLELLQTDTALYEWVDVVSVEEDWTLVIFPFENLQTHEKQSWPYNPFIGIQEDRDHEKRGLASIADALFLDKNFNGFKIVGGGYIAKQDSTRMLDGILISPYGVILLELKDHYGDVSLSVVNRGSMNCIDKDGCEHRMPSPYSKLNDIVVTFSEQNSLKDLDLKLKRLAAIIFTHDTAKVKIYTDDVTLDMPQKIGNIIIANPSQLSQIIKKYIRETLGKKFKLLSSETINELAIKLKGDAPSSQSDKTIIKNRYVYNPKEIIQQESTEYYNLFEGQDRRRKKSVWIKKYKLSTLTRKSIEEEAERIGREADALREFQKCNEIQDFYDLEHIGEYLYIVLEKINGITLEAWMDESHTHTEKLKLLINMSNILIEIEDKGIPHRALNHQNFRVLVDNELRLINFELCKIDYLPTLPPNERRALTSQFEAKEVSTVVNQMISTSVDIYSFAILITYILSGEVLITSLTHKKYTRNENNWKELANACKIEYEDFKEIKSAFDTIAQKRPSAQEMQNMLIKWRDNETK